MKKNKIINVIFIVLASFFMIGTVVKADDCTSKTCYCSSSGKTCGLYRNPPSGYTTADKTKCGCPATNNGTGGSSGGIKNSTEPGIDVCQNAGVVKSFQIVGWGLFILKIVAPIILIIMGLIELGKAVVSSDEKAIKLAISTLVKRAIAAVVIFFIPTIVAFIFGLVGGTDEAKNEFSCLSECINSPSSCKVPSSKLFD